MSFAQFGLHPDILVALEKMGFKEPSPVQAHAIPLILEGRDLIAIAPTGSGKTAACAIPVCQRVNPLNTAVQALIIVPTRELALQYAVESQKIGLLLQVKAFALFGGEDYDLQQAKLKHGVQVLVATPGRLIDFIHGRNIDLSQVGTLILDEADEMLSLGFYDDLEFIMQCLIHEHQTLLFSATLPKEIRAIARHHMKNPHEVTLTTKEVSPPAIEHRFVFCKHYQRSGKLISLIKEMHPKQGIIFCRSRDQCEEVCRELRIASLSGVDYLHAGLSQEIRTSITNKFRTGRIRFLVATDVAARGLDFSGVSHVFIYQLPENPDVYIHRSGRTGRFHRSGVVVSLVTSRELSYAKQISKALGKDLTWIGGPPPR